MKDPSHYAHKQVALGVKQDIFTTDNSTLA